MAKEPVSLLIKDSIIVTVDKERRIIFKGSIAVENSTIVAVDKTEKILSKYKAEETIDASGMVVAPGLIDGHVHLAQALLRGCGEDIDALTWLKKRIWPLQGHFDEKDGKASAALCVLEMMKSGTTCFLEVLLHRRYGFDGIAEVVKQSGIRGILSKAIMDTPSFSGASILDPGMYEDKGTSIKDALIHLKKWQNEGDGKIKVWFGPRPVGNCSEETYREVSELARNNDTGVTIHHSEVKEQVEFCKREYGLLPTEFMHKVGLVGRRVVYAHCIWMTEKEVEILAKTHTSICHVPSSDMKLGMGIAPIPEMLRAGVNVCVGCNGGANNNTYDILREASRACVLHRATKMDPRAVSTGQALEMATINGAKALGLENEIGSIEAGKKADLILINSKQPHLQPMQDPVSTLIHCANGGDVDTVVVDGKVVMKNRRIMTMEESKVLHDAQLSIQRVIERSGIKIPTSPRT